MSGVEYNMALQQQMEIDKQRRVRAEEVFADEDSIELLIEQQIYPNVFPIQLNNGSVGMGYYISPNYLVTNAHVLPTYDSIHESSISRHGKITKSFHRPDRPDTPDIVLVKTENPARQNTGIPTNFSEDASLDRTKLFFINYSLEEKQIIFVPLDIVSKPGEVPIRYRCMDETIPQPGCSGAPIIEARVLLGREPTWQFRQVAIVYARCAERSTEEQLLCAMPINLDLQQIYQLETLHEESSRFSQMALAASSINDSAQAQSLTQKMADTSEYAKAQFIAYTEGETNLDIELPEGLEKLIGSGIIKLEESLLLEKNQKAYKKVTFNISISLEELVEDLNSLFASIASNAEIVLRKGDSYFESKFLRVDIGESTKEIWKVDLQDNTGKGLKISGKSASSVFAIVRVPKEPGTISGPDLVSLFRKSMQNSKACDYNAAPPVPSAAATAAKKKKLRG